MPEGEGDSFTSSELAIVGTGRLARALGAWLNRRGVPVAAVAGRCAERAAAAACCCGPETRAVTVEEVPSLSHQILVVVSDDAVPEVAVRLAAAGTHKGIVLHTCGAHGVELLAALPAAKVARGVLHPLQTVTGEASAEALGGAWYYVDGDEAAQRWGAWLVARMGGRRLTLEAGKQALYHAAAVLASNHVVALLDAAAALLEAAGAARATALEALAPLAGSSLGNIFRQGAEAALTGPVRRGDAATVRRHLEAIQAAAPETLDLYCALSRQALDIARRAGLAEEPAHTLDALLDRLPQSKKP